MGQAEHIVRAPYITVYIRKRHTDPFLWLEDSEKASHMDSGTCKLSAVAQSQMDRIEDWSQLSSLSSDLTWKHRHRHRHAVKHLPYLLNRQP